MRLLRRLKGALWDFYVREISYLLHTLNVKKTNYYIRRILIYHNITENTIKQFQKQISYYVGGSRILSLSEFISTLQHNPEIEENLIAITFDDAYKSVYDYAVPILDSFGIKACIFVPVGFIEQRDMPVDYIRKNMKADVIDFPMSWEELRILVGKGYEIGSHSWTHIDFGSSYVDYNRELLESKNVLSKKLGCQIKYFSFPFGGRTNITQEALKKAEEYGYIKTFSGIRKNITTTKPFLLPRTYINPCWLEEVLDYVLQGYFDSKDVFYLESDEQK